MRNFLSLGGGVQSTALMLMGLHNDIDVSFEGAIFADTGWERETTYRNVEALRAYAKGFGVDVHTVKRGDLDDDVLNGVSGAWIPAHIDKGAGKSTMLKRQCTWHYKIRPIQRWIRSNTDAHFKRPVAMHIGISLDEVQRMKPSRVKYLVNTYPLITARVSRDDCLSYLERHGWQPAKSACIGCPYHGDNEWQDLNETELKQAIDFEERMQAVGLHITKDTGHDNTPYLHRSLMPLSERPFDAVSDQLSLDLQTEECDGGCFL
jgi:hypothetical protein